MSAKDSPFADQIDFKMFTEEVSSVKDSEGIFNASQPQVMGIGSSECEDLAGDRMLFSALEDMRSFSVRSAIWLNHRYNVPDDVFGAVHQAPRVKMYPPNQVGALRSGTPYYGVEIIADVSQINEAAMKTFRIINEDRVRLGFSIGCEITDFDVRKDENGYAVGFDIAHVRPLEWSVVGLPCNTQSWIENAVKGIFNRHAGGPQFSSEEEAAYIKRNYRDFDDITALYIHRHFDEDVSNFLRKQGEVYSKYGLKLVKAI